MFNLHKIWAYLRGHVYIPEDLTLPTEPIILHISDTPESFYRALLKLIIRIQPDYIIHTGDLVDNIKLEMHPNQKEDYIRFLKKLNRIIRRHSNAKLIVVLGNHDDPDSVKDLFEDAQVFHSPSMIAIGDISLWISHYGPSYSKIDKTAQYALFGHDITTKSNLDSPIALLNGIENIHIIQVSTKDIYALDYPPGTDKERLNKRKIGL